MTAQRTLVIGCGNPLAGDDAAGPAAVGRLVERGLPADVTCADAGTGGIDVALMMRGVPRVIIVDACSTGSPPGTLFEVTGEELDSLPPPQAVSLHACRWDRVLPLARWLLAGDYPAEVTACLVEGERFGVGDPLSPRVDDAIDRLVDLLLARLDAPASASTGIGRLRPGPAPG